VLPKLWAATPNGVAKYNFGVTKKLAWQIRKELFADITIKLKLRLQLILSRVFLGATPWFKLSAVYKKPAWVTEW